MPNAANDFRCPGILADLEDLWIVGQRNVPRVNIKRPKPLPEGHMLFFSQGLVAKEDDLMIKEGLFNFVKGVVVEFLRQVDTMNFGTAAGRDWFDLNMIIAHLNSPSNEAIPLEY